MRIDGLTNRALQNAGFNTQNAEEALNLEEGEAINVRVLSSENGNAVLKTQDGTILRAKLDTDTPLPAGTEVTLIVSEHKDGLPVLKIDPDSLRYVQAQGALNGQSGSSSLLADKELEPFVRQLAELNLPVTEETVLLMKQILSENPAMSPRQAAFLASNEILPSQSDLGSLENLFDNSAKTADMISALTQMAENAVLASGETAVPIDIPQTAGQNNSGNIQVNLNLVDWLGSLLELEPPETPAASVQTPAEEGKSATPLNTASPETSGGTIPSPVSGNPISGENMPGNTVVPESAALPEVFSGIAVSSEGETISNNTTTPEGNIPSENTAALQTATASGDAAVSQTATVPADATVSQTATAPADANVSQTATAPADANVSQTATAPADASVSQAATAPTDANVSQTATVPADANVSQTATVPADANVSQTATIPADANVSQTATTPADANVSQIATTPADANVSQATNAPADATISQTITAPAPADTTVSQTASAPGNAAASQTADFREGIVFSENTAAANSSPAPAAETIGAKAVPASVETVLTSASEPEPAVRESLSAEGSAKAGQTPHQTAAGEGTPVSGNTNTAVNTPDAAERTAAVNRTSENVQSFESISPGLQKTLFNLLSETSAFEDVSEKNIARLSEALTTWAHEAVNLGRGENIPEKLSLFLNSLFTKIDGKDENKGELLKAAKEELLVKLTLFKEALSKTEVPGKAPMLEQAQKLIEHVKLIESVNQFYYAQLPVVLNGRNETAELYIYKNKKGSRKIDPENVNILLALDLEHLGHIESLVNIRGKEVSLNIEVSKEEAEAAFKQNTIKLHKLLGEIGYKLTNSNINPKKSATSVGTAMLALQDFEKKHRGGIDLVV